MTVARFILIGLFLFVSSAPAENANPEVEYLLNAIGSSGCTFVRNGKQHDAEKAEDHLRMKYDRGRRYAKNTEDFIENLATKSSWSGKLYTIECPGKDPEPSGEWLTKRLEELRSAN